MPRRVRLACGAAPFALMLLVPALAQGPPPPPPPPPLPPSVTAPPLDLTSGTAAISGIVVDATTGRPVQGAVVSLVGSSGNVVGGALRQLTGSDGQFVFVSLPASPGYLLGARKFGYLDGGYGRKTPQSTTRRMTLGDGQWLADARITLWRPGSISGVVTDETGEPVVGAYVRLMTELLIAGTAHLVPGPAVSTDDRGIYRMAGLQPGRYFILVPSVQWTVPSSISLLALSGLTSENVASARAAGRDVPFRPYPLVRRPGQLATVLGEYPTPPPAQSPDSKSRVYPMTFYPQAAAARDASAIELGYGEERAGIDLQLRPVTSARVSGRVDAPDDVRRNLTLRLLPAGLEAMGPGAEAATTLINDDGTFTFLNVPPGTYTIVAAHSTTEYRYNPPGWTLGTSPVPDHPALVSSRSGASAVFSAAAGTMLWHNESAGNQSYAGRARVEVDNTDVTNVHVTMRRGVMMSGRIVVEQEQPKAGNMAPFLILQAEPANGDATLGQPRGRAEPDDDGWRFQIDGLRQGEYILRLIGNSLIKSVRWRDRDYAYVPFDTSLGEDITGVVVTMTDQSATIEGLVRDAQGAPASNAAVIFFPVDRQRWSKYGNHPAHLRSVPVSSDATWRATQLPAGDYYLVALDDHLSDAWKNPALLETAAPLATRVSIGWGESRTQELRLQQLKR